MAKGSLKFIRFLLVASILFSVLAAGLIILLDFNENDEIASVFWDGAATVINAEMPSYEDGSLGYILLMSVTAIAGVLFTSVLIGFVTSAIEEKIVELKKGTSIVLESNHIVLLGFRTGEYALLDQLILAAEGRPECIILADNTMDCEEMMQLIKENIIVPKNVRIVCRSADITDPASIKKCSIETCRTLIISPNDDVVVVKTILAVSKLMREQAVVNKPICAVISKDSYHFPMALAREHGITLLRMDDFLARTIAHSCTQHGLAETFREIFDFEGYEFHLIDLPDASGDDFESLVRQLNRAVPVGIARGGQIIINPAADFVLAPDDHILVFSETDNSSELLPAQPPEDIGTICANLCASAPAIGTLILGHNEMLPTILRELPKGISNVCLVNQYIDEDEKSILQEVAASRGLLLSHCSKDPYSESDLLELVQGAKHIVILSDHSKPDEDADLETISLLLNLRDIRSQHGLSFHLTVEMKKEQNQKLISHGDQTDFLIASSMASLLLAQLAENPVLLSVFQELLSNVGNELYLKNADSIGLTGRYTLRALRQICLKSGYILLGYVDDARQSHFNSLLDDEITLLPEYDLIVLGQI